MMPKYGARKSSPENTEKKPEPRPLTEDEADRCFLSATMRAKAAQSNVVLSRLAVPFRTASARSVCPASARYLF